MANGSDKERSRAFLIDESWPEPIKDFLMHLRELGLIFIRKRKDGWVCGHVRSFIYLFSLNCAKNTYELFRMVSLDFCYLLFFLGFSS